MAKRAPSRLRGRFILPKAATLSRIKTMMTYCLRGERFCDGHWDAMIGDGHIRRLFERLDVIASGTSKEQPLSSQEAPELRVRA